MDEQNEIIYVLRPNRRGSEVQAVLVGPSLTIEELQNLRSRYCVEQGMPGDAPTYEGFFAFLEWLLTQGFCAAEWEEWLA